MSHCLICSICMNLLELGLGCNDPAQQKSQRTSASASWAGTCMLLESLLLCTHWVRSCIAGGLCCLHSDKRGQCLLTSYWQVLCVPMCEKLCCRSLVTCRYWLMTGTSLCLGQFGQAGSYRQASLQDVAYPKGRTIVGSGGLQQLVTGNQVACIS